MDNGLTDIGLLLEPVDMERYEYIRLPIKERWAAVMPSGVPLGMGALGIWCAMLCDWGFRAIVFSLRWISGGWKNKSII